MAKKPKEDKSRFAKYESIRDGLKTGDIVLFSSSGFFASVIKLASRSEWSHVGMVVNIPEWQLVLLWESNTKQVIKDIDSGDNFVGVQLVALSQKVREYQGQIAIRRLNKELGEKEVAALKEFRKTAARHVGYENKLFELAKAAIDTPLEEYFSGNKEDWGNFFCSELVAEAYQQMGLLSEEIASNEYTPGDFASNRMKGLLKGFLLGEEETL